MAKDEEHCVAVDRLWRAVRRDLAAAIEECAGFRECEVIDPDGVISAARPYAASRGTGSGSAIPIWM